MSLKVGVVGAGGVARKSYLPALAEISDVELGYCNRTRAKADELAATHGGEVFDTIPDLMGWGPDTVLVLTSETARLEVADALLDHRPPRLFFEKPLVARHGQANVCEQDFFDAKDLLARCDEIDCETAMVFNYRFFEQVTAARQAVADRDFGEVTEFTAMVHYACWSHCIDLIHHFAGPVGRVAAVASERTYNWAGMDARDLSASLIGVNGAAGTLLGTQSLKWNFPLYEMYFCFERGRVRFRGPEGDLEIMDSSGHRHELQRFTRDKSQWDLMGGSFARSIGAYLEAVRRGDPPPVPGRAGLEELQTEAAIRRAIAESRAVDAAEEFPLD